MIFNAIFYKIVHNEENLYNLVYVGHTIDFKMRVSRHKLACNCPTNSKYNYKLYKMIREYGGWDNFKVVIIEEYPGKTKPEILLREKYWFNMLNANMNSNVPSRTLKEYYEDNKENILKYHKALYEKKKDVFLEKQKVYYKTHREDILKKRKDNYIKLKNMLNELKELKNFFCIKYIKNEENQEHEQKIVSIQSP